LKKEKTEKIEKSRRTHMPQNYFLRFLYSVCLLFLMLNISGCHGVAGNVIPQKGPSMESVYDSMGTPKNKNSNDTSASDDLSASKNSHSAFSVSSASSTFSTSSTSPASATSIAENKTVDVEAAEATKATENSEADLGRIRHTKEKKERKEGKEKVRSTALAGGIHTSALYPFKKLPNPELKLYVYPHFAGSDEIPIPGYYTEFTAYERTHYALPSETIHSTVEK
jgi:conjugative transfer region lipoprotein (TIGR03751 family)